MIDGGNRKFGLAALVAGGAVSAGKWEYALATFAIYVVANMWAASRNSKVEL